jgi:starch phosphorylase
MKAAANAVLNLSVPDGWWDEVWKDPENSNKIGWSIGQGEAYSDLNYQDQVEAEALYDLLENDVIPTFYERGPDRTPRRWVERMKACIGSLCHFVNTHRMVDNYMCRYYSKAHEHFRLLEADHGDRARRLAAAMVRIHREWDNVWVECVEKGPGTTIAVSTSVKVSAVIHLGSLSPDDVLVELYTGQVDTSGEIVEGRSVPMESAGRTGDAYRYQVRTAVTQSGKHGFTIRVRPNHPDLSSTFVPGLIRWADAARVEAAVAR